MVSLRVSRLKRCLHVLRRGTTAIRACAHVVFHEKLFRDRDLSARTRVDVKFSFRSRLFFYSALFRFPPFGRANVILIARLSALLCEFARHFFVSLRSALLPKLPSAIYFEFSVSHPLPLRHSVLFSGDGNFSRFPFVGNRYHRRFLACRFVSGRTTKRAVRFLRNADAEAWFRLPSLQLTRSLIFCWTNLYLQYDATSCALAGYVSEYICKYRGSALHTCYCNAR